MGAGLEVGLEDRLEHRLQGGLNNPIADRRNPEATELPAAFGDLTFLDRQRPKASRTQLLSEFAEELLNAHLLLDVAGGLSVHAG